MSRDMDDPGQRGHVQDDRPQHAPDHTPAGAPGHGAAGRGRVDRRRTDGSGVRAIERVGVELAATTRAAGQARDFVTDRLDRWAVPADAARDVVLAASELVTNAVEHGSGQIVVQLVRYETHVRLRVWDASPEPPVRKQTTLLSERNRGLTIVAALGATLGHEAERGGKWVWADFPHTAVPDSPAALNQTAES
jgi:anti-sigma regulatory factor (Ser/Thr protein kinase)